MACHKARKTSGQVLKLLIHLSVWIVGGANVAAAPQAGIEVEIQSRTLVDLGERLATNTIVWPRLDRESPADRQTALTFVKKCSSDHQRLEKTGQGLDAATYIKLIASLSKGGGYLNAVLLDMVYRMALSDIATTLVQRPGQTMEVEKTLASLQPGPWRNAGIGQILADHFREPSLEIEFSRWPERESLGRISGLFGKGPMLFVPKTSQLVGNSSPHDLFHRLAETHWMLTYALPGLLGYLRRGGALEDLDNGHILPFLSIMGDDVRKYRFPMYAINELSAAHLIGLREEFGNPSKRPRFLALD